MNFTSSRYVNDMGLDSIRLNPEIDDLLDWLQIYPQEPEYEMRNRVVESLILHSQLIRKKISSVRKIIQRVRDSFTRGVPATKIKKYVRGRIGVECLSTVVLNIQDVLDFIASKASIVDVDMEELGITHSCLVQKSRGKKCIELHLDRVLSSEIGIELLESISLEEVCISDKYSLEQIQSNISNMFCS